MRNTMLFFLFVFSFLSLYLEAQNLVSDKNLSITILDSDMLDSEILVSRIYDLLNMYRIQNGVGKLNTNKKLENGACLHSSEMVKYNFFSHTNSKNKTLRTFEGRASAAGYTNHKGLGENIYYSKFFFDDTITLDDIAIEVIEELASSASHNKIMLERRFEEIGVCVVFKFSSKDDSYECYVTQMFGVR